ncbi:MAG: alanine racemase [Pilosibacter sp.]
MLTDTAPFRSRRRLTALYADMARVATVEEGVQLRKHGITKEILILGPVAAPRYEECIRQELCMPVFELDKAEGMSESCRKAGKDSPRPYRGGYRNRLSRIGLRPDTASVEMVKRSRRFRE